MTGVLTKRETPGMGTHRKGHVRTQQEGRQRQVKRKASEKLNLAAPWFWNSSLQKCKKITFCEVTQARPSDFAMVALGNQCIPKWIFIFAGALTRSPYLSEMNLMTPHPLKHYSHPLKTRL